MIVQVVSILVRHSFMGVSMHDTKRAGHPQVHQEDVARSNLSQKVFGPPHDAVNELPLEPLREITRKVVAEVRATRHDTPDAGIGHGALQPTPLVFDFGQFWHSL